MLLFPQIGAGIPSLINTCHRVEGAVRHIAPRISSLRTRVSVEPMSFGLRPKATYFGGAEFNMNNWEDNMKSTHSIGALSVAATLLMAGAAQADKLTLYCSAQEDWCQLMARSFEEATGIDVDMTRKSSGETFAQIRAEASNPKGDVWWGGTGDPHLQAAEEGLTEAYVSPMRERAARLGDRPGRKRRRPHHRHLFGRAGLRLQHRSAGRQQPAGAGLLEGPARSPDYKGHVQMANPNSSGTAYTTLATMVQLFGEDEGFEFMKGLHANINQYTKSGSAPIKAAGRGETTIGIVFMHDAVAQAVAGFPIKVVAPCEGTGYEIGSMSIIEGARNMDEAKAVLRLGAVGRGAGRWRLQVNAFQVMSNMSAPSLGQGARHVDDQADRLRLRQVRLVGRAQAAAAEVGRRSLDPAAVDACAQGRI